MGRKEATLTNGEPSSPVEILAEEPLPETTQENVIPMPRVERAKAEESLTIPPSPRTLSPAPPSEIREAVLVRRILVEALGARLLCLLLVLLDMAVAMGTVYSPAPQRLWAMGGVFVFSAVAFWQLGRVSR